MNLLKSIQLYITLCVLSFVFVGCNKSSSQATFIPVPSKNQIEFATGFELYDYSDFKILKIKHTSPESDQEQTYILRTRHTQLVDSLSQYESVTIPLQSVIVTSTTHLPSLEMLGVENTLIGFPGLNYISSDNIRDLIEQNKIKEVGQNERINTEIVIDLDPAMVISFAINQNNQTLENLRKAGIQVMLNGDWNEKHPLGKAEWIKFFGALYDKDQEAHEIFENIKAEYHKAKNLAKNATSKPSVITGNMYQDVWYLPKGDSWSAIMLADANTYYHWSETTGTGSLAFSFEEVYDSAQDAEYWIGAGAYSSLEQMLVSNPHYKEFNAFKQKNVYSYSSKTGSTGGVIYYELGPNRPDLVLKDIIKITHPELLPEYELHFFEQLK